MLEARAANDSEYAGTMNLTHSLLRSRTTWLTTAFMQSDATSSTETALRRGLGTAEIQIGPHIFTGTNFFSIAPSDKVDVDKTKSSNNAKKHPSKGNASLVFEFAENRGVYFNLPLDFDILMTDSAKTSMQACFYANPPPPRAPPNDERECKTPTISTLDRDSAYPATEQVLARVNVSLNKITNPLLVDELLCYFNDPLNTVWRDYRRVLCKDRPVVKYAQSFFPPTYRQQIQTVLPSPRKLPPASFAPQPSKAILASEPCQNRHGGKVGYTAAVAATRLEYFTYTKESGESSADEKDKVAEPRPKSGSISRSGTPASSASAKSTLSSPGKRARNASRNRLSTNSPNACGRVCTYCKCDETPIWRRGPSGAGTLCNACGVKWKLGKILR